MMQLSNRARLAPAMAAQSACYPQRPLLRASRALCGHQTFNGPHTPSSSSSSSAAPTPAPLQPRAAPLLPLRRAARGSVAMRFKVSGSDGSASTPATDAAAGAASAPHPLGPVLSAVAVACAAAFAFGFNLGVVNGPLEQIARDLGFFGNKGLEGLVVSSTLAGAAVGSLTGGQLADNLGRRAAFLLASLPMLAGPLLSAFATDFNTMALGRFLVGLAIGVSSAVVPTYISEVAPTRIRGTLGTLNQLCICLGILGALLVNVALPADQWRTMFTLAVAPAVVLGLGMLFSPESPRWQANRGLEASAELGARRLWGPLGPAELVTEAAAATGGPPPQSQSGSLSLLSGPAAKPLLIGVLLFAFQQFAGINALVYFSSSVFKQAGVASDTLASAAVGATNVLGTVVAATMIEKAGRKQLMTNSFLGQAVAMFAMAATFMLPSLQPYAGPVAVVGTLAYILCFALGAGPVPALIVPELNPLSTRGKAVAAAFTSHWVCNVAVGQNFMAAVDAYGLGPVYCFFGAMALGGALYVRSQVPETKGKTLEQIEAELRAGAKLA